MSAYHTPVMLNEVLEFLDVKKDHWYVDCNLGGGGHTEGILKLGGRVIGIDLDPDSINEVAKKHGLTIQTIDEHLEAYSENLILVQSNFAQLDNVIASVRAKHSLKINGILFDLGVSSFQLESPNRGFSFNQDATLDMRMNPTIGASAKDLVNGLHEKELADLFWKLGEENFSRPIARRIVEYRQRKLIETTNELAQIITSVRHRSPSDRTHPATRVFQALRIAVNDELNSLMDALPKAFEIIDKGGRVAVISFHSLEDRIVKTYFKELIDSNLATTLSKKPVTPSDQEVNENPRSRSGKLRIIEKI